MFKIHNYSHKSLWKDNSGFRGYIFSFHFIIESGNILLSFSGVILRKEKCKLMSNRVPGQRYPKPPWQDNPGLGGYVSSFWQVLQKLQLWIPNNFGNLKQLLKSYKYQVLLDLFYRRVPSYCEQLTRHLGATQFKFKGIDSLSKLTR